MGILHAFADHVSFILAILRIGLASLMLAYGVQKLRYPAAFSKNVMVLLPAGPLRRVVQSLIPPAELLLGGLFLLDIAPTFTAICIGALLLVFTAALTYGWVKHTVKDCGCSRKPLPVWVALVRNGALLGICALLSVRTDGFIFGFPLVLLEVVTGAIVVLIAAGMPRSTSPKQADAEFVQASSKPASGRRALLRGLLGVGVTVAISLVEPISTAFAFYCDCSCDVQYWYYWTDCVCGIKELYRVEETYCCKYGLHCDSWSQGVGFKEC